MNGVLDVYIKSNGIQVLNRNYANLSLRTVFVFPGLCDLLMSLALPQRSSRHPILYFSNSRAID